MIRDRNKRTNEIPTEEFEEFLLKAKNQDSIIENHDFVDLDLRDYLRSILEHKSLKQKDVIEKAQLNSTYGWEIFNIKGKRPSRNKLLALAFACNLDLTETRRLLAHGRVSGLYAKEKRDAIIIVCIQHNGDLSQCDSYLYDYGLETITEG